MVIFQLLLLQFTMLILCGKKDFKYKENIIFGHYLQNKSVSGKKQTFQLVQGQGCNFNSEI